MTSENVFDVIVIGAGPAGEIAAARAARAGLTAPVVERRWAGGECGYYGCIPSKALPWPEELAAAVSRMPGVELAGPIDTAAVTARRDEFVARRVLGTTGGARVLRARRIRATQPWHVGLSPTAMPLLGRIVWLDDVRSPRPGQDRGMRPPVRSRPNGGVT